MILTCSSSSLSNCKNLGRIKSVVFFLPITLHKCRIDVAKESKWIKIVTFYINMRILGQVFQSRYYSVYNIVHLHELSHLLKFETWNASNLRFNIVDVFYYVRKEPLKTLFSHRLGQKTNFRDQFISDPPRKLIRDKVEIRL